MIRAMKPTVYLDSSVPSYWLEPQGDDPVLRVRHLLTRRWWTEELPKFEVFVSQIVLREIGRGQSKRAAERSTLLEGFSILPVTPEVERVAAFYVENLAMPVRDRRDAFHLALASVHEIDYLLTWNFAHLANARKRMHFERWRFKVAVNKVW
jgi:predicted nucleic acid-binding protein